MNAKIHVLTSFVALEHLAKLKLIELFVSALPAYRATPWLPVQKLGVHPTLNVLTTKSVITLPHRPHERNVNLCVGTPHVQRVHHVVQPIIEKYVLAIILFKETVMFLVQNVSTLLIKLLYFKSS